MWLVFFGGVGGMRASGAFRAEQKGGSSGQVGSFRGRKWGIFWGVWRFSFGFWGGILGGVVKITVFFLGCTSYAGARVR